MVYSKVILLESIITAVAFTRVPSLTSTEGDIEIVKVNSSSSSLILSFIIGMTTVTLASPALNVTVSGVSS